MAVEEIKEEMEQEPKEEAKGAPEGENGTSTPPQEEQPKTRTFSEEEVNKIIRERLAKERTRLISGLGEDIKSVKDASEAIEALKEARAKAELERDEATAKLSELKILEAKRQEATRLSIPEKFIKFITGTTEEEVKQSAEKIAEEFKPYFKASNSEQITTPEKVTKETKGNLSEILRQNIEEAKK